MTEQPEVQFGSPDCTCIPWTRQDGERRHLGPGDTVDQISGWERGTDCPHHAPRGAMTDQPARLGPIDYARQQEAERETAARTEPTRHTVDTITSDALAALYESLEAAQEGELYRQLRSADNAFASATVRAAKAERAVNLLADSHRRADRAEAAIARVRALADTVERREATAGEADGASPGEIRDALDEPKEPTT